MKWKCLRCHGAFYVATQRHDRCPFCGSNDTIDGAVERNEPVLVMISGDLPLELERVPFRAGQVVRLERVERQGSVGSVFTEGMFSNYIRSMMRNW